MSSLSAAISDLSAIDIILDELNEDLGDLPQQVASAEDGFRERTLNIEATENTLKELEHFKSNSHIRLQEIKDKEDILAAQQFNVRNNREFDAITHEIEALRSERTKIFDEQRTVGVKEENLRSMIAEQQSELDEAKELLNDKEHQLSAITLGHNDEILSQTRQRISIISSMPIQATADYERIRTFHKDSAVKIRKNSCSGCFNAVPPQKIVEMRNKPDQMFLCEHCGRILISE